MAPPGYFNYATLTTSGNAWRQWAQALDHGGIAPLEARGGTLYGLWAPLFGLASNQVVMMTQWAAPAGVVHTVTETSMAVEGMVHVESHVVVPTVRPTTSAPPQKPGLYVHRWFLVEPQHVEEVVELSATAWDTFEQRFDVEIIGCFRTLREDTEAAELMLLTWYPNLAAWETSRQFDQVPAARQRFLRRQQLTKRTTAIATTLVGQESYLATNIS
jgi:hypothetical protein